jgi:hypothetical protein
VVSDHGECGPVLRQYFHLDAARPAGACPIDQRPHQGGTHALPLPRVGYHDAELGPAAASRAGGIDGHPVPDDRLVAVSAVSAVS